MTIKNRLNQKNQKENQILIKKQKMNPQLKRMLVNKQQIKPRKQMLNKKKINQLNLSNQNQLKKLIRNEYNRLSNKYLFFILLSLF